MKTPRLLIVEDDPAYQLSLEMLLEKLDFGYRIAASGEQALEIAQNTHFDLALLDIQLAGTMTGIDLAGELIRQFGTPIIFLTANDDLSTYEKASDTALAAYLVKPVNEFTLRSVIRTTLQKNSFHLHTGKALEQHAKKEVATPEFIFLKFKGRTERVEIGEIMFAQADGNYCYLHTPRRRFVIKTSLNKISEKLKLPSFLQVHRSFIVRLDGVKNVDLAANKVQVGQEQLPLGASFKDDLLRRLQRI